MVFGVAVPLTRYVVHELLHRWLLVPSNIGDPTHSLDEGNIMYPEPGERLTKENWDNLTR